MKYLYSVLLVAMVLVVRPIAQAPASTDVVGDWDITTVSPLGENTNTMTVSKNGEGLKAVAKSPQGERPYDKIELKDRDVTIVMTVDYEGSPMVITYAGKTDGKTMSGDCDFGGLASGSWSAARK